MAEAFARIECHYFVNGGFFDYDGQIIAEVRCQNGDR
jgi:proline iminopeptidase